MNLKTFNKIAAQVAELVKSKIKFDVSITNDNHWQVGAESAIFEPIHYEVNSLKQLSDIQTVLSRPIRLNDSYNKVTIKDLKPVPCVKDLRVITEEIKKNPGLKFGLPTLKFYSNRARDYFYNFNVAMIADTPTEQIEEDVTYRYIGDTVTCLYCIPHTHSLYNYLDKGFFYTTITDGKREKIVITNELTLDTYLCLLLAHIQPSLLKQLPNECFINANQAKLLRIKFEKDLKIANNNYGLVREAVLKEYEKSANSNLLQRVAEKKVSHATYNNIRFTHNSATYETISIQAEELLLVLQNNVAFDDRTDIYTVIRDYINYVINQLEEEDLNAEKSKLEMPVETGDAVADKKAMDKYLDALSKEVVAEYNFTVNGIPITLKRTSENSRRYINGVTINKIEVQEVAFQASCYNNADDYNKFVKSVSKMSLKWHNALANGIPVKIHSTITYDEYRKPLAPSAAPRIKFTKDDKDFKLVINDTESVKIKFNDCLNKLATLNRKTNDSYLSNGYGRRDHNWAKRELIRILRECCTFEVKTTNIVEVDEPVMTEGENPVQAVDKDGNLLFKKVKKKETTTKTECLLTEAQGQFIGKMAEEFQKAAIKKSEVFLQNALKATGAKQITFKGEEAYLVEGALRKYAVLKRTNQVYNYDSGNYVCIVEPGHQVQVGFDALAGRLYALKNDSVMVGQIGTLRHG